MEACSATAYFEGSRFLPHSWSHIEQCGTEYVGDPHRDPVGVLFVEHG